jgi:hypothetical protein
MRTTFAMVLVVSGAAVALGASAGASTAVAPPNTRICGQIHGPHASYVSVVSGIKSSGTAWTVIATGVPCTYAMSKTPGLLKLWAKARLGARIALPGYTCLKMTDRSYSGSGTSSGGFLCHRGSTPAMTIFGPSTFTARETAPYSVAQIKAFFGIK